MVVTAPRLALLLPECHRRTLQLALVLGLPSNLGLILTLLQPLARLPKLSGVVPIPTSTILTTGVAITDKLVSKVVRMSRCKASSSQPQKLAAHTVCQTKEKGNFFSNIA
jgi:hypothetical protein